MMDKVAFLFTGFILGVLAMTPALIACLCNDRTSDGQSDALIGGGKAAAVHDHSATGTEAHHHVR